MTTTTTAPKYVAFYGPSKHEESELSNFYRCNVTVHGLTFASSEAAYQAGKLQSPGARALLAAATTAEEAWSMFHGPRKVFDTPTDWDDRRVAVMRHVLHAKFTGNPELGAKLLATGAAYLVENCPHKQGDFWADNGDGTGQNRLGTMLMELREWLGGTGVVPVPEEFGAFYSSVCAEHGCTAPCHFTNEGFLYDKCDLHMPRELSLGAVTVHLPLADMPDGTGRFLYFKLNDLPELVRESARMIHEHLVATFGAKLPALIMPETSMLCVAHELRLRGVRVFTLSKTRHPGMHDVHTHMYAAATSTQHKVLHMSTDLASQLDGPEDKVLLVDNVCTTGATLSAMYHLMVKGLLAGRVVGALVLFTEGLKVTSVTVAEGVVIPLTSFAHLPMFATDIRASTKLYVLAAELEELPSRFGPLRTLCFRHRTVDTDEVKVVQSHKAVPPGEATPVRVHDACATSELFGSQKCDCRQQLDYSLKYIGEHGGVVIYLSQEGRGIGYSHKLEAYKLQTTCGLDTVDANRALGLPDDLRVYTAVKEILEHLGVRRVAVITNNPRKLEALRKLGLHAADADRIPCNPKAESKLEEMYVATKAARMGHMIGGAGSNGSNGSVGAVAASAE
jgi:GTP cyclohydrolase II